MIVHGIISIENNDIKICITHMPFRKKPCLAVQIGDCLYKVARFDSEEKAFWFIKILDEMFERREDEVH